MKTIRDEQIRPAAGTGVQWCFARLSDHLFYHSSASAVPYIDVDGELELGDQIITVHDFLLDASSHYLAAGTRVVAMYNPAYRKYYVTSAECA